MLEYLYNAIRATAGEDITIFAKITNDDGAAITENCHLMIYDDLALLLTVDGVYSGDKWEFNIPESATSGLNGRYWYCICADAVSLCFKQPIYFI